jgi:cation/acetate symporter
MIFNAPTVRAALNWSVDTGLFLGIQPISAGILGVPVGFLAIFLGSCIWPDRPESLAGQHSPSQNPYPGL